MTFDPKKPVQTRDGRPARIVCRDAKGSYPIVAMIEIDGEEQPKTYTADGKFDRFGGLPLDLINIPTKRTGWVNVYPPYEGSMQIAFLSDAYRTREEADKDAAECRIACVQIEWEE